MSSIFNDAQFWAKNYMMDVNDVGMFRFRKHDIHLIREFLKFLKEAREEERVLMENRVREAQIFFAAVLKKKGYGHLLDGIEMVEIKWIYKMFKAQCPEINCGRELRLTESDGVILIEKLLRHLEIFHERKFDEDQDNGKNLKPNKKK
jgi:hypothetical protein